MRAWEQIRSMVQRCMTALGLGAWCWAGLSCPGLGWAGEAVKVVTAPGGGKPADAEVGAGGEIHLVCDAGGAPYYVRSNDGGATFSAPLKVVEGGPATPGLEFDVWDLAVGMDGRVYVALGTNAWKLKLPKDQWGFHLATLEPGAKSFAPVRNINHTPGEGFSLAVDDKGNVAAFWLASKLYASLSRDGGKTFPPGAELNPAFNPCDCCTTRTSAGPGGVFACLYREETSNERDMYVVLQGRDGRIAREKVSATPWPIKACPMTYFSISAAKDGYVAAWPTKGEIYFARLNAEGKVLPPGEVQTPGKSGMRTGVLARAAPDGRVLVAWNYQDAVNWQLYDAKGAPAGAPGSAATQGKGVAGVVGQDGTFILFK